MNRRLHPRLPGDGMGSADWNWPMRSQNKVIAQAFQHKTAQRSQFCDLHPMYERFRQPPKYVPKAIAGDGSKNDPPTEMAQPPARSVLLIYGGCTRHRPQCHVFCASCRHGQGCRPRGKPIAAFETTCRRRAEIHCAITTSCGHQHQRENQAMTGATTMNIKCLVQPSE